MNSQPENPFRSPQTIDDDPVDAELWDDAGPRGRAAPDSLMVAWFLNLGLVPLHMVAVPVMGPLMVPRLVLSLVSLFTLLGRRPIIRGAAMTFFVLEIFFFATAAFQAAPVSESLTVILVVCVAAALGIVTALAMPSARKYYDRTQ